MMTVRRIVSWPFLGLYHVFSFICMVSGSIASGFWALAYWIRGGEKPVVRATTTIDLEPRDRS